jgi:hypothetical protein
VEQPGAVDATERQVVVADVRVPVEWSRLADWWANLLSALERGGQVRDVVTDHASICVLA